MPAILVFSDFDGTISLQDIGCVVIDDPRCFGYERRRGVDHAVMDGKMTFRDGLESMWDAVTLTWDEAWDELLHDVKPDPGFSDFYDYCKSHDIPVKVVSSGLRPMIERILVNFIGDRAREIEIISNEGVIEGRKWKIVWRDETPYGHDKSRSLIQARGSHPPDTTLIFIGDGVSDISAAQHADVLFARRGCDLEQWCAREGVPFRAFDTFEEIKLVVAGLTEGRVKIMRDEKTGFCDIVQMEEVVEL